MSLPVLRVVWGRLRTDWAFLLACWLLVATATTLVTAGALYADTVELGGVRRALAEANPADQGVLVRLSAKADQVGALHGKVRPILDGSFDEAGADVSLTTRSASLQPAVGGQPGVNPDLPAAQQLIVLGSYDDLEHHATIVDGRWPAAGKQPIEATVSEKAAAALGVAVGSRLQLADAATPRADPAAITADVQLVGIWRPEQRADAYWLGDALDLDGVATGATTTRGPLMVTREDLLASATGAGIELRWRALPHVTAIQLSRIDALRADISGVPGALGAILPANPKPILNTKLADVLGTIDQSVSVSRAGVVLVILQFVLLAGYAVLLAGALLVERRRPEVALLRARGARGAQVGTLAVAESLAIAVPAAVVSPFIALAVIEFIGNLGAVGEAGIISAPSLSATVLAVTLLASLACVVVMSLPALVSDVDLAHVRASIGRPLGNTMAQRIGLDVVLLAVTAIGLFQLQSYGSPLARDGAGNITLDPVLVAAPALALAAGALLVIRLVPRIGEIAERLLRRQRGLTVPMASRQVARRPLRYTRTALLIVLATALGTFAATYTSTWADSQAAQATYQAGADIRLPVNKQSELARPPFAATLAAQTGVSEVTPVTRESIAVGGRLRSADVLMLDAAVVTPRLKLPTETEQRDGAALLAAIGASDADLAGLPLPAGTRRVALVIDASLDALDQIIPGNLVPSEGEGIAITADVLTAGGTVHLAGRAETYDVVGERIALTLPGTGPASAERPMQLLGVRLQIIAPVALGGDVSIVRVDATPTEAADDEWRPVALASDLPGWTFQRSGSNGLHFDNRSPVFPGGQFGPPDTFVWGPPVSGPLSIFALVNDAFLAASGSAPGGDVSLTYHGGTFAASIVGAVPNFPSLEPTRPFLVLDRPAMRAAINGRGLVEPPTNEWWLWVDEGTQADVAAALAAAPISAPVVISELGVRQSLQRDPIALGLVGALLLGSLAAAVCAAIGLIVGAIVTTRERRMETALLRALGMSRRGVTTGVALDNGYLLAFGLPAGIGLGILIALIVLPNTPLNRTGLAVVPAPHVVIPVEALVGVVSVGLVLLIVTIAAASRAANGARVADVLRAGDD